MSGRKIYENFTNGTGPEGLSSSAAIVNEIAARYGERAGSIRRLTAKMEAAWQGEASAAARRGFGPLEVEHDLAAAQLATAQDLTNRQAGSWVDARNSVVPVPPEPTGPDPWALFKSPGEVVNYRQQVAEYNAANQHNVDVMTRYGGASGYNASGLPTSYGALSSDQAGFSVAPRTSDGGPRDSGPKSDAPPPGGRGVGERASRYPGWVASPPDSGGPAGPDAGAPPESGSRPPQQTTPGGVVPAPGGPVAPVPVGPGGGVGSGPPNGGPMPATGFVPVGGGPGESSGGPGGRGLGVPGSEVRGPGGRAGESEPHGPGRRPGAGPLAGGAGGEPHAGGRGGFGAGRGGSAPGGMPFAGGGRGRGAEDIERKAPEYLREEDPEGLFGSDELTAPTVIGEEFEDSQPDQAPSGG